MTSWSRMIFVYRELGKKFYYTHDLDEHAEE